MRPAAVSADPSFEDTFKADRLRALEATRRALDEAPPVERLTDAQRNAYRPPDPYIAGLRKLQETRR
jgi:hypothetical protein